MSDFADDVPHQVPEEWFLRFMEGPTDGGWPKWLRRTYLWTAPVSFPLYWIVWGAAGLYSVIACKVTGY